MALTPHRVWMSSVLCRFDALPRTIPFFLAAGGRRIAAKTCNGGTLWVPRPLGRMPRTFSIALPSDGGLSSQGFMPAS